MLLNVKINKLTRYPVRYTSNHYANSLKNSLLKVSLCLFLTSVAWKTQANNVDCHKTLSVSAVKDWPPYSYLENDKFTGLDIELLENLFAKNGLCAKYVNYPSSSRAIAEFQKGNVDVISAASLSPEREAMAEISVAYRHEVMGLFARQDTVELLGVSLNKQSGNFAALKNQVIAINRGSVFGKNFDTFLSNNTRGIIKTNLAHERISLLQRKRVDFVVEDSLTGLYLAHKRGLEKEIVLTDIIINDNDVHYMIRRGVLTDAELKLFNQSIIESYDQNQQLVQDYIAKYQ